MSIAIQTSERLDPGSVYTRAELREMFGIRDATLNTGIFQPRGHASVWLFVTEAKTTDRTQYVDRLEGDVLHWQGQTVGTKDRVIIEHEVRGLELLLFYRRKKYEYRGAGFRYEGRFAYQSHAGTRPTSFVMRRSGSLAQNPTSVGAGAVNLRVDFPYVDVDDLPPPAAPAPSAPDPDAAGRGLMAHRSTQSALAKFLRGRGLEPRSPASSSLCFDVLWRVGGRAFVAEVKSLTSQNEEKQLRLGLGQVLRYRQSLCARGEEVTGVLVVERKPSDRTWCGLAEDLGIRLVWPETFDTLTDRNAVLWIGADE